MFFMLYMKILKNINLKLKKYNFFQNTVKF